MGGVIRIEGFAPNFVVGEALLAASEATLADQLDLREFIDYKTSMITDEHPLRGLLFY